MLRYLPFFVLAGCAIASESSVTTSAQTGAHEADVRAIAQPFVDRAWANGLAIGIVANGQVETYGLGAATDGGAAPDENTLFEIGSSSKIFTSLLLAEAIQRGEVTLDQELDTLLPSGVVAPTKGGKKITLRHLSTHGSGLPRLPPSVDVLADDPYASYTNAEMYRELPRLQLATAPGTTYAYSNLGAALLGQVLADRANEDYSALVKDRITTPLGLASTTADFSTTNAAEPHDENGDRAVYWHQQAMAPAGAVRSTLHDMLRFAQAEMTAAAGTPMALTQQIAATLNDPQLGGPRKMGLGWHTDLGPSREAVLWHNGETGGFYSFLAVDVQRQAAVVVLANTAETFLDNLGIALLAVAEGEHPTVQLPPLVDVDDATLATYEGRYDFGSGFILDVAHEQGRLYVTPTGQPKFRLFPESATVFDLHAVAASLEFSANAVTLHQGGDHVGTKLPR